VAVGDGAGVGVALGAVVFVGGGVGVGGWTGVFVGSGSGVSNRSTVLVGSSPGNVGPGEGTLVGGSAGAMASATSPRP